MKELLQQLTAVYSKLNSYYSEQLVDSEKISDVNDDINEDFQEDIENLARGIHLMEKLDIDTLKDANKQLYLNGMFDIYTSLLIHIQVSKKIRYLNGEITHEEYLDDGHLNVEVVDDEDDDTEEI